MSYVLRLSVRVSLRTADELERKGLGKDEIGLEPREGYSFEVALPNSRLRNLDIGGRFEDNPYLPMSGNSKVLDFISGLTQIERAAS
jgi:hypothetical protein